MSQVERRGSRQWSSLAPFAVEICHKIKYLARIMRLIWVKEIWGAGARRNWKRIYADPSPPRSFIAVGMQFAMMEPADGNRVFVADLSAERTKLGQAKVMGLRGCSAADYAGLCGDEFAVLLVTQANGLRCPRRPCRRGFPKILTPIPAAGVTFPTRNTTPVRRGSPARPAAARRHSRA